MIHTEIMPQVIKAAIKLKDGTCLIYGKVLLPFMNFIDKRGILYYLFDMFAIRT